MNIRYVCLAISPLALLLLSSCVHTKAVNYTGTPLAAKPKDYPIEILDPTSLNRPYKVIGTVEANSGARYNLTDPMEGLRKEARSMGADALLAPSQTPMGNGGNVGHVRDLFICKAIVWTD